MRVENLHYIWNRIKYRSAKYVNFENYYNEDCDIFDWKSCNANLIVRKEIIMHLLRIV